MEQFFHPIESYLIHQAFKARIRIGEYGKKCSQRPKLSKNMQFDADAGFVWPER